MKALREQNKEKALHEVKSKNLENYGFYAFIKQKQFKIIIP